MIFLIKHRWYWAVAAMVIFGGAAWLLGGWRDIAGGSLSLQWQVIIGLGGGCAALAINGALYGLLKRALPFGFVTHFQHYAAEIADSMHWPEYLAAGVLAALGEEPLFRGVVLRVFANPILGIAVSALVFAACHWLRLRYFGYWLWAMWEGVLFGILLVATGSLLVPILAHGVHDVVGYRIFQHLVRREM